MTFLLDYQFVSQVIINKSSFRIHDPKIIIYTKPPKINKILPRFMGRKYTDIISVHTLDFIRLHVATKAKL